MSKQYIDSQEHWEDSVNADYDKREQQAIEQAKQEFNELEPLPNRTPPIAKIFWRLFVLIISLPVLLWMPFHWLFTGVSVTDYVERIEKYFENKV